MSTTIHPSCQIFLPIPMPGFISYRGVLMVGRRGNAVYRGEG